MFSKLKKQLSFIMIFTLVLQIVAPLTSLATNQSEQFNGKNLILKQDGYIHTTIDEGKVAIIKTYTDDGILLEEVIIDRNENRQAIHLDYNKSRNIEPTKTIINFEDYGITKKMTK